MKSRKQAIFAALMSSIIAVNSFGVSAFANDEECAHENTEERAEVAANCVDKGLTAGTYCTDCDTYISGGEETEVDSENHKTVVSVEAKAATCTNAGNEAGSKCTACDTVISGCDEIAIVATAHVYSAEKVAEVAATCTADGTKAHYTCTECNKKFLEKNGTEATATDLKIAATGHTYAETWTSDETNHWHAATCSHTDEKKDSAAHTWVAGSTSDKKKCSVCDKEVTVELTEATCDHTRVHHEAVAATSCQAGGTIEYWTCETCTGKKFDAATGGNEIDIIATAPLAHNFGEWTVKTPATTESAGVEERACTYDGCTEKETRAIAQLTPTPAPTPDPDPTPAPTPDPDPTPAPVPTEAVKVEVEEKEIAEENNAVKEDVTVAVEPGKPAKDEETGVSVTVSETDAAAKDTTLKVEAPTSTKDIAAWAEEVLTNVESAKAADVKKSVEEAINAVADGKGFALNLKLVDNDNKTVQPDKTVQVTVPVPEVYKNAEKLYVYHITERGAVRVLSKMVDGNIVINAGSFSPYIITTEELTNVKTYKTGDADLDENLTARDATAVLKHCVDIAVLKDEGLFYADMNGDSAVSAADATLILKSLVETA